MAVIRDQYAQKIKESPVMEHNGIEDYYRFETDYYVEFVPETYFNSQYKHLFTHLEISLRQYCITIYEDYAETIIPKFRSPIISKYYNIKKFCDPLSAELLDEIHSFRHRRNALSHRGNNDRVTLDEFLHTNKIVGRFLADIGSNLVIPDYKPYPPVEWLHRRN